MIKDKFLENVESWNSHLPLLWLALEATKGMNLPVTEFGSGNGSTPYLREYCLDDNRTFYSYDYNQEWADKTGSTYVSDWNKEEYYRPCSVILIDQSPGEERHLSAMKMKDRAQILVLHDSEPVGGGDYQYAKAYPFFKYKVDLITIGAWATALSNHIDVTKWSGQTMCGFEIK